MKDFMTNEVTPDLWSRGWCRLAKALPRLLNDNGRLAQTLGTYCWMLLKANHAPVPSAVAPLRGQLHLKYEEAAQELGITVQQLRTTLATLKRTGVITSETKRVGCRMAVVVTISDYDTCNGYVEHADEPAQLPFNTGVNSRNNSPICLKEDKRRTEKKEEKEESVKTFAADDEVPVALLKEAMLAQERWVENYVHNHGIDASLFPGMVDAFIMHLQDVGTERKSLSDALPHFANWHKKRHEREKGAAAEQFRLKQAEQQRIDEQKRYEEERKKRLEREQRENTMRIHNEIIAKAKAGDPKALEIARKYGFI